MSLFLTIVQIILGLLVIGLVLLQAKGTGLGRSFGSSAYHSRRGAEKIIFRSTIILCIAFVVVSIVAQFV